MTDSDSVKFVEELLATKFSQENDPEAQRLFDVGLALLVAGILRVNEKSFIEGARELKDLLSFFNQLYSTYTVLARMESELGREQVERMRTLVASFVGEAEEISAKGKTKH